MLSGKFLNYLYITKIETSANGNKVRGSASSSRKATEFDKNARNGYVRNLWFIDFAGKESTENAKKLKVGDKIIVPPDQWSITNGEEYETGKYSKAKVTIWNWSYNDGAKKSSSTNEQEPPDDDDVPF